MKIGFPSLASPLVNPQTGVLASTWIQFFQKFVNPPPAIENVILQPSPFSYIATSNGFLSLEGGNITNVQFTRGSTTFTLSMTSGIIPMSQDDIVVITYTVAPTIRFVPE